MIHHSEFSGLHQNSFMKRIFDLQKLFGFTRISQLVKNVLLRVSTWNTWPSIKSGRNFFFRKVKSQKAGWQDMLGKLNFRLYDMVQTDISWLINYRFWWKWCPYRYVHHRKGPLWSEKFRDLCHFSLFR